MVKKNRLIDCSQCGETSRGYFPTGYRAVGIDTCPECGSRNIDINLREP